MKKKFYRLLGLILKKLIKMYNDYQVNSITSSIKKCLPNNIHSTIQISNNTALQKLVYEIKLESCEFNQIIESTNNVITYRMHNMDIKLNADNNSYMDEILIYNQKLENQKELINKLFEVLILNY